MRGDANRADAWAATAVWDAEGLVEVQVAHIGSEASWSRQSQQRIQVGPVDIDLTSGVVNHFAEVNDAFLEHPVSGGIGHHDRSKLIMILRDLVPKVVQIDSPIGGSFDHDNSEAGHRGRGSVRPMRRRGDQANATLLITA